VRYTRSLNAFFANLEFFILVIKPFIVCREFFIIFFNLTDLVLNSCGRNEG